MRKTILRVSPDELSFLFPLHHTDHFTHLRSKSGLHRIRNIFIPKMGIKKCTGVLPINFLCQHRKRTNINPIAIFQHIKVIVGGGDAKDIRDASRVPGTCSHPIHVMISPLDIYIMKGQKFFHDAVRPCPPIVDIPDNVQTINAQILDQLTEGNNKLFSSPDIHDSFQNFFMIEISVFFARVQ